MINILLLGANGRMGQAVAAAAEKCGYAKIAAGIDISEGKNSGDFPVFQTLSDFSGTADVIIDFSHHSATEGLLAYAIKNKLPAVLAATGHTDEEIEMINNASKEIPIFRSRNMSLGINLLISLAKKATAALGDDFDIEIVEKHHNQKLDAPSGTALMLADGISEVMGDAEYVYDRHNVRKKRDKNEIGIHAIRGGTIVGDHDVIFAGQNEVITLSHSAASRDVFANGALRAAAFICDKTPGLYNMNDIVGIE